MKRVLGFLAQNGSSRATQHDALGRRGCTSVIFEPALDLRLVGDLVRGDELVVWRLDELGLNAAEIIAMIARLSREGIGFGSIVDGITLSSPVGEFCVALTGIQKKIHRARVVKGIDAARDAGHPLGRNRKLTASDIEVIEAMIAAREISVRAAALQFGIGRSTLQRYLSEARERKRREGSP